MLYGEMLSEWQVIYQDDFFIMTVYREKETVSVL